MSEYSESTKVLEELLVIRCQSGDESAFKALVKLWHPRLMAYANRVTRDREAAQDIAQECWPAVIRGLPRLRDAPKFGSWIYRIVHNKCIDWIRKKQKEVTVSASYADPDVTQESPDATDTIAQMRKALAILPDKERIILTLFYLEERSMKEISEVLSLPEGTVKSRLFYAREKLKKKYKEVNNETI